MSSWHEAQSEHNRALADALDSEKCPDWVITSSFYAALHLVDAAIRNEFTGVEPHSHPSRINYIARSACLKSIATDYQWLYDRCHEARYRKPHTDIRPNEVKGATDTLERIGRELMPLP
jgi:hypothetical protein